MQVSRLQAGEYAFQTSKCLQMLREFRGKMKLKSWPKTFNLLHMGKMCPYCQVCKDRNTFRNAVSNILVSVRKVELVLSHVSWEGIGNTITVSSS